MMYNRTMKKYWAIVSFYFEKYPARVTGYLSAISLNGIKYWQTIPMGILIPIAMLFIGMGEGAQRLEDRKTIDALYKDNDPKKKDYEEIEEMVKLKHKHRDIDISV